MSDPDGLPAVAASRAAYALTGLWPLVDVESFETITGSAAALGAIDAVYVAKHRISPIYLVDAAAQAPIVAGWIRGRA
jgi:hypothetical protein